MKIAVYPGSFDPVTNGHIDIIARSANVFDSVIVMVAVNPNKKPMFTPQEREDLIHGALLGMGITNVFVTSSSGTVVDFARENNSSIIIRGLRALTDFEIEFQMAHINRRLDPQIDTMFFATDERHTMISSSLAKELYGLGKELKDIVPPNVARALTAKIEERRLLASVLDPKKPR
jgi:pantetheine-phosphate adenylyltransferase